MLKVLLTNGYFYKYDQKQWGTGEPYPPLGTLYATSYLRQNNYDVSFYDSNLVDDHNAIHATIESSSPDIFVVYDDGFNYLTKMCLTRMREAVYDMLDMAKKNGAITIVNSSDSTDHFESYLEKGADYIIHGEGEETLLELCNAVHFDQDPTKILGISFKENNKVIKNPGRPVRRALDEIPMPAWDMVDVEPYRKIWKTGKGFFSINIATTRGCPYKCNWCAKPIYGNRYNTRTPLNVIDEIEYLIRTFDVRYFWMCDDIFGLKPNWVQEFRDLKKERNLSFQYKIQSRADLMLKEDNLDALAESGAHTIWIGAESGSQAILDAMDKGTQVDQIYVATKLLKARNVRIAFFLQFGYLGETIADIRKTIKMVLDLMPDDIGISVSYPLPGTKFYDKVKSDLITKQNWVDSNDLDLMFENTYPPIFYKTLHKYVHNRYRIKKGYLSILNLITNPFHSFGSKAKDIARLIYHSPQAVYHDILLRKYAKMS